MCWNSPYSVYNKWSFGIHCHASFNMWYSAVATCNYLSLFLLLHTEKRSMIYWYIYTNVLNSNNHGNLLATPKTDRWNNFDKYDFKKVDDFLAVSYYFPYYILLYIYAQRRNKESYLKLCKQGIKAQKSWHQIITSKVASDAMVKSTKRMSYIRRWCNHL